ncbi:MAG: hypothetical protein ACRCX8_15780 [Sarcina sp.]
MTNNEKFQQSVSDIVDVIYDLTGDIQSQTSYVGVEENLNLLDKLSSILKRMGDTLVIEKGEVQPEKEKIESE